MMARYFILGIMLFFGCCFSQESILHVGIRSQNEDYAIINLKDKGALLMDKTGTNNLYVQKIDTALHKEWKIEVKVSPSSQIRGKTQTENHFYLLFDSNKPTLFDVSRIAINIGASESFRIPVPSNFVLSSFKATDDDVFLLGYEGKDSYLIHYTYSSKTVKHNLIDIKEDLILHSMIVEDGLIYVSGIENGIKNTTLKLKIFDFEGNIIEDYRFVNPNGEELFSLDFISNKDKKYLISNCGDFKLGTVNPKVINTGLFIVSLDSKRRSHLQYIDFLDLKHGYDLLHRKELDKIESINKRKIKRGEDLIYNQRVHITGVRLNQDQIIVSAEMIEPTFFESKQQVYNNTMVNNFDPNFGYKYLGTLVLCIDSTGKLLWDQSLYFSRLFRTRLKNNVEILHTPEGYTIQHKDMYGNKTRKFLNNKGEFVPNSMGLNSIIESVNLEGKGSCEPWYKDTFLFWKVIRSNNFSLPFSNVCIIEKVMN
ncbi:MAG: hypothetical protein ACRCVT_16490 [Leadbetterella sp.]